MVEGFLTILKLAVVCGFVSFCLGVFWFTSVEISRLAFKVLKYIAGCIGLLGVKIYNLGKCSAGS